MSSENIWFPFYPGDYLRDTMHLRLEHHGAYLLLLLCFWDAKGVMPDDDETFAGIVRVTIDEWKSKFRPKLAPFFKIANGQWTQSRVQREYNRSQHVRNVRSAVGKLGGRPKQNESKAKAIGLANVKQNETSHSHSHSTQSQSQSQSQSQKEYIAQSRFTPPSIEETKLAAAKCGLPDIEAEKFFNFYESKGWMVGKNKMKAWAMALAGWKNRWQQNGATTHTKTADHSKGF